MEGWRRGSGKGGTEGEGEKEKEKAKAKENGKWERESLGNELIQGRG